MFLFVVFICKALIVLKQRNKQYLRIHIRVKSCNKQNSLIFTQLENTSCLKYQTALRLCLSEIY